MQFVKQPHEGNDLTPNSVIQIAERHGYISRQRARPSVPESSASHQGVAISPRLFTRPQSAWSVKNYPFTHISPLWDISDDMIMHSDVWRVKRGVGRWDGGGRRQVL